MKEVQVGEIIHGAEIINEGCFWDNKDQLIIPIGRYLGEFLNQLPYGRIDKKVPGIGATSLELDSDRNSIIVVPTQYLAYSKSLLEADYMYVGGYIDETTGSSTEKEIDNYINDSEIINKKLIVVADSLRRVINVIKKKLDGWFIVIDEIDSFQEQANFRPKLEEAIDYFLLFNPENRCLLSATLKDFSNKDLMGDRPLTFNHSEFTQRKLKIINAENIYNALIVEILKNSSNIINGKEKILVAFNSVIDAFTCINILPEYLKDDCKILCSKYSQSAVTKYYGELKNGELPGKINFITSAYYTGIDFYDSYHLIYVTDIKRQHTLFSVDKINQIYGRCRTVNNTTGEPIYRVLSETLINNSDGAIKNEITYTKNDLLEKAELEVLTLDCVRTKMADRDLEETIGFQKFIISMGNYFDFKLTRFNSDNIPLIAYFNIDSIIEHQYIRQVLYESGQTLNESLENSGFETESIDLTYPMYKGKDQGFIQQIKNMFSKEKDVCIHDTMDQAFTNILNGENTYLLMDNSKGEENKFYRFYNRLKDYVQSAQLNILLENIKTASINNSFSSKALKNIEINIKFQTLGEDTPFKKYLKNEIGIGQTYNKSELVNALSRTYSEIGITKKLTVQNGMEELYRYVKFKPQNLRKGLKRQRVMEVINFNPKGILIKEGVKKTLWIKEISMGKFSFDTIY